MDGQAIAVLGDPAEGVDIGDVELGVHALREEVHGQRDHVDVARALTVAEQRALHPVGPGHHAQLGGRHRAAPVIVRVQGQHDAVAVRDMPQEPLDGVGIEVRGVHLDRRRQVQDELLLGRRLDDVHDRLADLDGELHLGARVALGRVLVEDLGVAHRVLELPAQLGRVDGDVDDARLVEAEHHPPLQDGRGVVEVHDGPAGSLEDSYVRWISSGRHWVRTWIVTSSGTRSSSIRRRTKSKSGCDAEGNPTSISLNPILTRVSNIRRLRSGSIGSMSAWLPSRRSTEHQRGAFVSFLSGQVRSGRSNRHEGTVLVEGHRLRRHGLWRHVVRSLSAR